jgi:hypothetical protein
MANFNDKNPSLTPYCTFAVEVENSENFTNYFKGCTYYKVSDRTWWATMMPHPRRQGIKQPKKHATTHAYVIKTRQNNTYYY